MIIKFSNKVFYTLITIAIMLIVGFFVYAQYTNIPNPGHSADQIAVIVDGQEKTLQEAIDSLSNKTDLSRCQFHLKPIAAGDGGVGGEGISSSSFTENEIRLRGANGFDFMYEIKICYNCGSGEICDSGSTKIYLYESD